MAQSSSVRLRFAALTLIASVLMPTGESSTTSAQQRQRQAPAPPPQAREVNSTAGDRDGRLPGQIPAVAPLADLGPPPGAQGPFVGEYVTPAIVNIDLSTLRREMEAGPPRPVRPRRGDGEFVADRPSELDPIVQHEFTAEAGRAALSGPILNFDGIVTGASPHDPNMDVGPNHVFQMVNSRFSIFDKAGTLQAGPSLINTIWTAAGVGAGNCATQNLGDPVVLYDQLADRWFISQFANPTHLCFAVSQGPNPVTSGFFVYEFNVGAFPDYFKVGVWPSGYFVGAQIGGNQALVAAFNRGAMLTGAAANFVQFTVPGLTGPGGALGFDLILPSDHDGPTAPPAGAPNIFYRQADGNFWGGADRLDLFQFNVNFGVAPPTAAFTALPAIATAAFDAALCGFNSFSCVPQPGTAVRLDPINEPPMYPFRYRNFGSHQTLVGNFAVDANGADGAGIRWFELRNSGGGWALQQEGTYAPQPGGAFVHRWMGAAAMDGSGNIAVLYSVAGGGVFPGIRYAGRAATDPAGQLPLGEVTLVNGGSSFIANTRWGDYGSLSIDPSDDCTFWGTQEYTGATNNRRTRIGSFRIDTCGVKPDLIVESITPVPGDPAPGETVNVTVRVRNVGTAAAGSFYIDFYMNLASAPGAFQVGDFACLPASLAIGATFDCTGNVSYPSAGTFNMFAQVDTDQGIVESNEANNVFGPQPIAVAPLPDLTVTAITTNPVTPAPGDTVDVQVTVMNVAPGTADNGFFIDFYQHSTTTPTSFGDFACGIGSLGPKGTATCNGTVVYSSEGTYQMWARVDLDGFERETNEGNNIRGPQAINVVKSTITVTAPDNSAIEDGLNPGTFRISRSGSTASSLTVNHSLGGSAVNGTDYVSVPGATTIPAGAAFVDRTVTPISDTVKEADETAVLTLAANAAYNVGAPNSATVTITEGADLLIAALVAPVGANPGQTISVKVGTKNQGTLTVGTSTSRIWLSANNVLDASDTQLADISVPALNANQTNTQTVPVMIPGVTPLSKRFLLVKADATNGREANENNNVKSKAITIGPDYIVSKLSTVPASVPAGSSFTINDTTKNNGGPTAVNTVTRFYLSADKVLNVATDAVLGERTVNPLAAGASNAGSTAVTMPIGTTSGIWYIIAAADTTTVVTETSEANNRKYAAVSVP